MTHLRIAALALPLAIAIGAPTASVAQTELIYNSYLPPFNSSYKVAIKDLSARIEKESGGSLKITIPDSSLAPSDRQYEMVRDGIADLALVSTESVSQLVTLNQIANLPGNSPSTEAASVAHWETYNKYFKQLDELKGVIILGTFTLPGRQIMSVSDRAPKVPGDLAGAKIWATSSSLVAAAEAVGGVPLNVRFPELQEYVTKRNLDVLFITAGSADGAKVLDKVTHYTKIPGGLGSISLFAFISKERFDSLTGDQQAAIMRAADGLSRRYGQVNDAEENEVADIVAKIPTTEPDGEALQAFQASFKGTIDGWMERARAAGLQNPEEVMEFYKSVLKRETGGS